MRRLELGILALCPLSYKSPPPRILPGVDRGTDRLGHPPPSSSAQEITAIFQSFPETAAPDQGDPRRRWRLKVSLS
jgi:hypothetical protein